MAVKTRFDLTSEQEHRRRKNSVDSIGKFETLYILQLYFNTLFGNLWGSDVAEFFYPFTVQVGSMISRWRKNRYLGSIWERKRPNKEGKL